MTFSLIHRLHDRTGRLENVLPILGSIHALHDRTGRLEKYIEKHVFF